MRNNFKWIILFIFFGLFGVCGQTVFSEELTSELTVLQSFKYMKGLSSDPVEESGVKMKKFQDLLSKNKLKKAKNIIKNFPKESDFKYILLSDYYIFLGDLNASKNYILRIRDNKIREYYMAKYYYEMGLFNLSYKYTKFNSDLFLENEYYDVVFFSLFGTDKIKEFLQLVSSDDIFSSGFYLEAYKCLVFSDIDKLNELIESGRYSKSDSVIAKIYLRILSLNKDKDSLVGYYDSIKHLILDFNFHFLFHDILFESFDYDYGKFEFNNKEYYVKYNIYLSKKYSLKNKTDISLDILKLNGRKFNYNIYFIEALYFLYKDRNLKKEKEIINTIVFLDLLSRSQDELKVLQGMDTVKRIYKVPGYRKEDNTGKFIFDDKE